MLSAAPLCLQAGINGAKAAVLQDMHSALLQAHEGRTVNSAPAPAVLLREATRTDMMPCDHQWQVHLVQLFDSKAFPDIIGAKPAARDALVAGRLPTGTAAPPRVAARPCHPRTPIQLPLRCAVLQLRCACA